MNKQLLTSHVGFIVPAFPIRLLSDRCSVVAYIKTFMENCHF